jgi:hypothetical protein
MGKEVRRRASNQAEPGLKKKKKTNKQTNKQKPRHN